MGFGIGLGYMAQGVIQGRQQNIQNRLQEEQNQRAEDANKRAQEAADRAAGLHQYDLQKAQSDAAIAANNASPENLGYTNTTNKANADYAGQRAVGAGLQNQQTQQRIELNKEQLTPEAKSQRQQSSAIDLRIKQRNEQLLELKHSVDMAAAKRQQEKLTDIDAYETIQRLRQGDKQSALRLFNGMDSNGIYDATDLSFDQQGNLHIKRQSGEDLIYPVNAIGAIEQRVKTEMAKNRKAPDVQMIEQPLVGADGNQVVDDNGKVLMQKIPYAYNPKTDKWDPISTSGNSLQISHDDVDPEFYKLAWKLAVLQGKRSPEGFIKEYGYDPRKPSSSDDGEFGEGEITTGGLTINQNSTSEKTTPRLGINALKQP